MKMWNVKTGECARNFLGHFDDVNSISLSNENEFIISRSADRTLKLWNV